MKTIGLSTLLILLGSMWAYGQRDYFGGAVIDMRASTAAEGAARGMADVARSAGQYNLMTSKAAINMTEAQRNNSENREQWTDSYFKMRQANKQYRATERAPRATMEDLVRFAQAGKPQQLSPSELDIVSGAVSWPTVLKTEPFRQEREKLDALFAARARQGVLSFEEQSEAEAAKAAILRQLQSQIDALPPAQYMQSKRFVEGLVFTARQPTA